ncbi:hypothetical protein D3C85_1438140 [compost metagenome]
MNRWCSPEAHGGIQVVLALQRGAGFRVRYARLHAHRIAGFQVADILAHGDDHPGGFMAQHHGLVDDEGPDGAMLVIMNVTATDPDIPDGNAHVILAHALLERNIANR